MKNGYNNINGYSKEVMVRIRISMLIDIQVNNKDHQAKK
jgi:hypothetical protein